MFHTWKSFLSESGTYAAANRKPHSFLSAFSGKGKGIIYQAVPRFLQAEYSRRYLPALSGIWECFRPDPPCLSPKPSHILPQYL